MANLFYDYNYVLNSEPENEENNFENDSYAPDIFTDDNVDVTDFEKHIISHKKNLEQRLKELQATMVSLKKQVEEEKFLWKKQLEEAVQESMHNEQKMLENPIKNVTHDSCDILEIKPNVHMTASEYDEKLTKYEDALLKAHAEKKANLKRQIVINNYKRRLMEVENMCNMELLRVKQSVQYLQPLQMMASEWKYKTNESMMTDVEITGVQEKKINNLLSECTISDEKLGMDYTEKQNDEVSSVVSKMNCCCLKIPKVSSSTQVWGEDESIADNSNTNYLTSENYKHLPRTHTSF
ncbi:hypothetical protein RN001_005155 [Aquatica leii]|uniref:Uncharacterized protein n=1 Tax=Aquatica leii TaxID=1421715 RepID=A0AAN7SAF7_9COLE|nr:hypothetical protein RN001_005155 [Aquatica leii]